MSRPFPLPRLRAQTFQRHASGGDEMLAVEIELHTERGGVAVLRRWGGPSFTVVLNGSLFLLRPDPLDAINGPIGSYLTVALALAASDAWAARPREDDDGNAA